MRLVNRVIEGFEDLVVALGLGIATLAAFSEVVARFIFNTSIGSGGELTNYPIIWAAMVGAAVAARSGVHIGVDILVRQMSPMVAKITVLLSLLASAMFTLIVTWLGIELVQFSYGTQQTTMELLWPRWILFLSVPVGMSLMTYHLIQELVRRIPQPAETFHADVTESEPSDMSDLPEQHAGA
jgi:C4-dicarboxylate transporter, DctQ subunit